MGEGGTRCAGCGKEGSVWCDRCRASVVKIDPPMCRRCGYPSQTTLCEGCRYSPPSFDQARSWARYGGELKNAILFLKREENRKLARVFAEELYSVLCYTSWDIDLIAPVPLSSDRIKSRGFNQSELIAAALGNESNLPLVPDALYRLRSTQFQSSLGQADRVLNLKGAFLAVPRAVKKLKVLLVDDLMVTGATVNSASKSLLQAGARSVFVLTIGRSVLNAPR